MFDINNLTAVSDDPYPFIMTEGSSPGRHDDDSSTIQTNRQLLGIGNGQPIVHGLNTQYLN